MLRKSLFSFLLAILGLISLKAQTEQGTFMIGTDIKPSYRQSAHRNGQKTFQYYGHTKAGYFIKNNLLVGGELGLSYYSSYNSAEQGYTSKGYSIGLFGRKYFDLKDTKWKPFIELSSGYQHGNFEAKNLSAPFEYPKYSHSAYIKGEVGISYFIRENLSLNASYYTQGNFKDNGFNTTSGFKFGINFHFNGKKNK